VFRYENSKRETRYTSTSCSFGFKDIGARQDFGHRSYFSDSLSGVPLEIVKQYIEQQKTPD